MFLFHRYTNRAGYLQRTSYLQLEDAPSVLVLCVFLGLTSGSLVWWESGLQPVWLDGRGWIGGGRAPGGLGGVSLLSRGVKLAKSSRTESFRLAGHKLKHGRTLSCTMPIACMYIHK